MNNRFPGTPFKSGIYGDDEPMESLAVDRITPSNAAQFGSKFPDKGIPKEFSLGPWHELRRQMSLFATHVMPLDRKEMSPRREPGSEIEWRCDAWIVLFLKLVDDNRILIPPPRDLSKWLYSRALMALSLIDYEIRTKDKREAPKMKKQSKTEIGSRLVIFWQEMGKQRWLETDPDKSSIAE